MNSRIRISLGFISFFFIMISIFVLSSEPWYIPFDELRIDESFVKTFSFLKNYCKNPYFTMKRFYEIYMGIRKGRWYTFYYFEQIVSPTTNLEVKKKMKNELTEELFISIMINETHCRNVTGDGGKSIGYFQIQWETYEWVKKLVSERFEEFDDLPVFKSERDFREHFIRNPRLQGQIVVYILYFTMRYITKGDLEHSLIYYNRGEIPKKWEEIQYHKRIMSLTKKLEEIGK